MQVRSLSIKTTEILQLELTVCSEAEKLLEEIDALMFSMSASTVSTFHTQAIRFRLKTLVQLGWLLPAHKSFIAAVSELESYCEGCLCGFSSPSAKQLSFFMNRVRNYTREPQPFSAKDSDCHKIDQSSPNLLVSELPQGPQKHEIKDLTSLPQAASIEQAMANPQRSQNLSITIEAIRSLIDKALSDSPTQKYRLHYISNFIDDILEWEKEIPSNEEKKEGINTTSGHAPLQKATVLIVEFGGVSLGIPITNIKSIKTKPQNSIEIFSLTDEFSNKSTDKQTRKAYSRLLNVDLCDLLRCEKPSIYKPVSIEIHSRRGDFILNAPTEGRSTELFWKKSHSLVRQYGPYLGAAIDYHHEDRSHSAPLLILDIDQIGATLFPSHKDVTPQAPKQSIGSSKREGLSTILALTFEGAYVAIKREDLIGLKLIPKNLLIGKKDSKNSMKMPHFKDFFDPDILWNGQKSSPREYPDFIPMMISNGLRGPVGVIVKDILDQAILPEIISFGFPPPKGTFGLSLCEEKIITVLNPTTFPI